MRIFNVFFLFFCLLIFSCKKDKEDSPSSPAVDTALLDTELKMRQKWDFDHSVLNNFVPAASSDTIYGQAGDYFEFKADNYCYAFYGGLYDTVFYKVLSASSFRFGGDTLSIATLTTSKFSFINDVKTDSSHYNNVISLSL